MYLEYFYCDSCGIEKNGTDVRYVRSVANGDVFACPQCGEEVLVNEQHLTMKSS